MVAMKWVLVTIGVLSAFVIGFGLGWTLHRPEVRRAEVATTETALPIAAPSVSIAATASAATVPEDDTAPFPSSSASPGAVASSHQVIAVDATHFIIDAGIVDDLTTNQATLLRQVRLVPEMEDGGPVGIRAFGVRRDSFVGKLGIENGDRLESINGHSLADLTHGFEAYTKLRGARDIALTINRRGAPMTLHYHVTGKTSAPSAR